ncbi:DHH family phosphoesterase [Mycoplasma putrefaciens]|uniref:Phosphoesterase, DHH family protein n=1 Tax=Mycoplasma putrefaciens (strain ATCC 15718 / NCTC 10155 / C30 KS-1 / KS-1) TaxID=743965 RepID=A0A7U3ZT26_MYCPK|nr:bifunctional oligoribonuclease/PAP phosphatase NrnA [Mycoplasma putrefaciens]AEM69017.1 Phosphoesterase, DHH family protein [Mycoplasma putrefaciens KS1]
MLDIKKSEILIEKIKQYNKIIIAKHKLPDWDAQGSAMGLAYIIEKNFDNKTIYVVGDRLNDDTDFLANQISDQFVSDSLLITVDTAVKSRVDFDRFDLAKETFKIDHHINVEDYADNDLILDSSIANTMVISLWAMQMNLIIPKKAAHNLYLGLLTDSGRFLYDKTDTKTFMVASKLLEFGADLKKANDYLYVSPLKMRKWMNFAFSKVQFTDSGIAYLILTKNDLVDWDLNYEEIKTSLLTMAGISEIKIWFTVIEYQDQLKLSLRSRDYEVNKIAQKYNGGGHRLAAGAKLVSLEEVPTLILELEELLIKG